VTIVTANDGIKTGRGKMSAASVGWRVGWRGMEWNSLTLTYSQIAALYQPATGTTSSDQRVAIMAQSVGKTPRQSTLPSGTSPLPCETCGQAALQVSRASIAADDDPIGDLSERLQACITCGQALLNAANEIFAFDRARCENCCGNYVCARCPTDKIIPGGRDCAVNCEACCLNFTCAYLRLVWNTIPECLECAGYPDLRYDRWWPSQLPAGCRPNRWGSIVCDPETFAKLMRCKQRAAWNGCPPLPTAGGAAAVASY